MGFPVDIWSTGLHLSTGEVESLVPFLSPDERARADRFQFDRDRRRFIVARARLRQILSDYLNSTPRNISFIYSPKGKPSLPGCPLQFNVSHSQELAVYGISWHTPMGIDLEFIRPLDSLSSLTKRFFCASEGEAIERSQNRTRAFFRIWTAKEAYLKATGEGIGGGLQKIEISLEPSLQGSVKGWIFEELPLEPDYIGTVCYRSQD